MTDFDADTIVIGSGSGGLTSASCLGVANDLFLFEQNPEHYEHCHIGGVKFDYHAHLPTMTDRLLRSFSHEQKGIGNYMELLQNLVRQFLLRGT